MYKVSHCPKKISECAFGGLWKKRMLQLFLSLFMVESQILLAQKKPPKTCAICLNTK